jgi:hypothetical protein
LHHGLIKRTLIDQQSLLDLYTVTATIGSLSTIFKLTNLPPV